MSGDHNANQRPVKTYYDLPWALRLADELDDDPMGYGQPADELRRLHAENEALKQALAPGDPLTDEQIQDLLKKGNPTDEEMRLVRLGYSAQPYDQTALELCESCGWKTLIPGEGCLNCERKPQHKGEIAQARAAIAKATGGES